LNNEARTILRKKNVSYVGWLVIWLIFTVFFIGPFVWMILTAVKPTTEILTWPPTWWPSQFTAVHFQRAWQAMNWPRMFWNSTFIATTSTIGILFFTSLAAFAFARLRFPLKNLLFLMVLATMIVPTQVDLIPRFLMMNRWRLVGSAAPIILLSLVHAFHTFFYRQFFQSLPQDLFDSARIDGASFFRCYWMIAMPLSGPVTAALVIFTFLIRWNEFLYPLIYLHRKEVWTVQLGLAMFQTQAMMRYGPLMAASAFVCIPTLLVYLVFQRHFVRGIVMTGIKG